MLRQEGGGLLPGDLLPGYIFDFVAGYWALTTTSFDSKNYTRVQPGILLVVSRQGVGLAKSPKFYP